MDDFEYHITQFKCLKAVFIFNFFKKLIMEARALNNLLYHYTENDVSTKIRG